MVADTLADSPVSNDARYHFGGLTVITLSVLFMVVFDNHTFWSSLIAVIDVSKPEMWLFLFACFGFIFAVCFTFFALFGFGWLLKPLIAVVLVLASATSYYMDSYGTVFDDVMVMNVLQTNIHEAFDLLEPGVVFHIALYGLLPVLLLSRINVKSLPLLKTVYTRAIAIFFVLSIASLSVYASYKDFSFVFRENREISFFVNPVYPMRAIYRYTEKKIRSHSARFVMAMKDAHRIKPVSHLEKNVLVLVVGETAREQNFHLDGYSRETTPLLEKQDVISFRQVYSCGTATAISLPCMFSDLNAENFDDDDARNRQNLLDALKTAGLQVQWRENNPDCKGVCDRVQTYQVIDLHVGDMCEGGSCYDEALLKNIDQQIANIQKDAVIVLHTMGSHGPSYYKRYPDMFKKFEPECQSSAVQDCSDEELVNAYDNTILYTDYILSMIIDHLKQSPSSVNTAMLYVSDHGESLGENGVYLHGLPYYMAPDYQKHIPMILWMSDGFSASKQMNRQCLQAKVDETLSHDNVFHSVLGLMDVSVSHYRKDLDLFDTCRSGSAVASLSAGSSVR